MKRILAPIAASLLLFTAGCKNTSPVFYSVATATAVSYGLRNSPETANYLRAIQPLTCSLAGGTNVTPADVVRAIESSGVAGSSPEARAILSGIELLYIAAYDSLGANTNASAARPYLEAVFCDGFSLGLAVAPSVRSRNALPAKVWWPLLKK